MAFENLVGNEKIKSMLINAVQTNNILHSYLFTGIDGIGKSLFAKEFAKMILCMSNGDEDVISKPCRTCKSCIEFESGNNPDFLQIDAEDGKTIKIEQIRYLQEKIAEKPVTSDKKVYIINDSETMTREAQNALLKTLEEPPTYATLILITANESKLLATIKSRCTKIAFNSISDNEIKEYINQNKIEASMTENMIKQCSGSIGRVLKIADEKDDYEQIENVIEEIETDSITKIWRKAEILYSAKDKILDLLDYMNIVFYQKLHMQKDIKYTNCISIIEEAKKRIIANANYDMTIDNLLLKLWEEFH